MCHQQTCDNMFVNESCHEVRVAGCVCPENMYLDRAGNCVDLEECWACHLEDGSKKMVKQSSITIIILIIHICPYSVCINPLLHRLYLDHDIIFYFRQH